MAYLIGVILAAATAVLAVFIGFERERAFYPTLLIVIATYYILFAAMGAGGRTLIAESLVATIFLVVAVLGYRKSAWIVAAALCGHGIFDFFHHLLIANPGVPQWWPGFCLAFDVTLAVWVMARHSAARADRNNSAAD
ncbi:MAG: DUF6010 family protein [Terriglobales bacterium]